MSLITLLLRRLLHSDTMEREENGEMGMKDVIGMDSFRIGDVTYTDADLASLPVERLEELKIKVNSDIIAISTQIKMAPLKPEGSAEAPKSPEWYINANHALAMCQRFLPYLSNLIRKRRQSARTVASFFMDVAREELDPKDFQYILDEAKARYEANQHD